MEITILKPRMALNKAFLKVKPIRIEIENFKTNLIQLLDRINDKESEEFHKNLVSDFLKKTYYEPNLFINTKGRNDLVIHNGDKANSTVGVILEAKKPTNKAEMLTKEKLNTKAFQELVLYYLRERITQKNLEVKFLIATNINEWFIFDAMLFDRLFAQNKNLVKQFNDFEEGRLADTKTDFFYKQIAEPFIAETIQNIEFTYFDIREYDKQLRNADKDDDNKLISLFKLLSPEHLLKLPFANDSNSLDKRFYGELLHIIGLTEIKDGGKKLIDRNKVGERNQGSLLENAIIQLDSLDKISRLEHPSQFGANLQERLFNVAIELCITWINRILFLKLLEAQLITYHKGDKSYEFLSSDKINDYDDLNSLFFQVLARQQNERNEDVKLMFSKVPYLNSSLFEPTEMEHSTLFISQLRNDKPLPIYSQTVLKDSTGRKKTGNIKPLEYLFEFLNAYDFASEGSEEIQEDNKTLINASVLGLIFEKINGYKDGSFFTPGFITMYMCRETIRKAVVQKFNDVKGWNCTDINSLYDKIEDRNEANKIINDLKICDPAVGSGHFLVSALNEIIAIKNDLKILQDREGRRLKEYHFEVVNDELSVTDEDGDLFEYNPTNKESQRIQETLFHEKQTIIENCLFGVDINPNSVKICRLRLWIELLKNAYYKNSPPFHGAQVTEAGGFSKNSPPFHGAQVTEAGGFSKSSPLFHGAQVTEAGGFSKNSPPYQGGVPEGGGGYHINNLPHLKTFRKELRNNLTPAEAKLWTLLKGKALEGRKFRRQHSVANYILDFYCPEENLAIELDGQGHFEAAQAEYDYERDLFLNHVGIKVLRFENKIVWDNPEGLLQTIKNEFGKHQAISISYQPPRQTSSATPPYKGGELRELETLPNIDINIKCGNSLISRFALDSDLKDALKKSASRWTIDSYRLAVATYRNAESKEQKREMERLINEIKTNFRSEITFNDPKLKKLNNLNGDLQILTTQTSMFELSKKEKAKWEKDVKTITTEINKLEQQIEEIKSNKIYDNAFEWRFEFPEVLNDDGDFVGFDVVIGNPPYVSSKDIKDKVPYSKFIVAKDQFDLYSLFMELSIIILKSNGMNSFIVPDSFLARTSFMAIREYLYKNTDLYKIVQLDQVFPEANVSSCLFFTMKSQNIGKYIEFIKTETYKTWIVGDIETKYIFYLTDDKINSYRLIFINDIEFALIKKIFQYEPIIVFCELWRGEEIGKSSDSIERVISSSTIRMIQGENISRYFLKGENVFIEKENVKKNIDRYSREKLFIRQLGDKINAAYSNEGEISLQSVYCLYSKDKKFENKYILAILNSQLINFLYQHLFAEKQTFPRILLENIKKINIPLPNNGMDKPIINLVNQILSLKQNDPQADTRALEAKIDQLVYHLYGLTDEEIRIVEGA